MGPLKLDECLDLSDLITSDASVVDASKRRELPDPPDIGSLQPYGGNAALEEEGHCRETMVYRVIGVMVHQGSRANNGHYYAFTSDPTGSGKLFQMNDEHVYEHEALRPGTCDWSAVHLKGDSGRQAYVVVMERVDQPSFAYGVPSSADAAALPNVAGAAAAAVEAVAVIGVAAAGSSAADVAAMAARGLPASTSSPAPSLPRPPPRPAVSFSAPVASTSAALPSSTELSSPVAPSLGAAAAAAASAAVTHDDDEVVDIGSSEDDDEAMMVDTDTSSDHEGNEVSSGDDLPVTSSQGPLASRRPSAVAVAASAAAIRAASANSPSYFSIHNRAPTFLEAKEIADQKRFTPLTEEEEQMVRDVS